MIKPEATRKSPFYLLSKDEGFAISKIGFDRTSQGSVDLTVLSPARKPLVSMDMDVILPIKAIQSLKDALS